MQFVNNLLDHLWHGYLWRSPGTAAWTVVMLAGFATAYAAKALEARCRGPLLLPESERPQWLAEKTTWNTAGILGTLVVTNLLLGAILGFLAFGATR